MYNEAQSLAETAVSYVETDILILPDPRSTLCYHISCYVLQRSQRGALVDRGANGGILGDDAMVLVKHVQCLDVTGIDNHELTQLPLVDAASKTISQRGPVILIMHKCAYHGVGRSIHSSVQIEGHKNKVDDVSMRFGGTQTIRMLDGYILPLDIINGLPYLKMTPPTPDEFKTLPHVILTSPGDWDPTVADNVISDRDDWYNNIKEMDDGLLQTPFDECGAHKNRSPITTPTPNPPDPADDENPRLDGDDEDDDRMHPETNFHQVFAAASDLNRRYICVNESDTDHSDPLEANPEVETKPSRIDYEKFRPYFLHVPKHKVEKTFNNTTQHATNVPAGLHICLMHQSPNPAFNVWRRHEPVATDTIEGEVPAIDCGHTHAQIFVGRKSLVLDVCGMSNTNQFVNTLEDNIRKRGAMDKLISDSARLEISARVKDVLRALIIDDWQSERNYQHQNFAER